MSAALRATVLAGALALALTACGGSSPSASSSAAPSSSFVGGATDGPFPPTASASSSAAGGALVSLLAPAPTGFAQGTDATDRNGALSASDWEQIAGPGAAARYHFQDGAVVTYVGSSALPNEVVYQLVRFGSAGDASQALADATASVATGAITKGTDPSIPGSTTLVPKSAPSDGSLTDYSVVAAKGAIVMFADFYAQRTDDGYPAYVDGLASAQYARLP